MTKFEQVGMNFQYEALDKRDANKSFQYSCRVCCERGMRLSCDRCAIATTHAITIGAFDTNLKCKLKLTKHSSHGGGNIKPMFGKGV